MPAANPTSAAVAEPVLAALSGSVFEGSKLLLQGQMDRKLYAQVAKVIEAAGGKWERRAKAHVFPGDACDAVEPILLTGRILRVQSAKQEFGAFFSPPAVAARVAELAAFAGGEAVLEPSAGHGALALPALLADCAVDCIDVDPANVAVLSKAGFRSVQEADFLTVEPASVYDCVVMNPPFARQMDISHITHALRFLRPGGRLVAVASASVDFRVDRKAAEFRDLINGLGGEIEKLPESSFRASGTDVNTVVVTAQVPA